MLLQHKILLFAVPALLVVGGAVAYHDGVMADDVKSASTAETGDDVSFKGRVFARNTRCEDGDAMLKKDVQCFAVRDLDDENSFALVSTTQAAPAVDEVVVVRGVLKMRYEMEAGSGSTQWQGGCWNAGQYGSGCWDGGSTSWSWPGLKVAWIDARSVDEPWIF